MRKNFLLASLVSLALFSACTQDEVMSSGSNAESSSELATRSVVSLGESATQEQALAVAEAFMGQSTVQTRSAKAVASVEEIKKEGKTLIYVINYEGGGFALVSAKTDYFPVLAYSDENTFDYREDMHPGLLDWLDMQEKAITGEYEVSEEDRATAQGMWEMYLGIPEAETEAAISTLAAQSEAEAFAQRVHEIGLATGYGCVALSNASSIFSSVGASSTYNQLVNKANQYGSPLQYTIVAFKDVSTRNTIGPLLTTEWHQYYPFNALSKAYNYPTGCVTIAMAQIMKFHRHPSTYNWSDMPNTTATQSTQILIRDITNALGIEHDSNDSGSDIYKAEDVFTSSQFQYNATLKENNITDVQNAISKNEPVYMRGESSTEGHAWVCDGSNRITSGISYFVEYRSGSSGSYRYSSDGTPNIDSPTTITRPSSYLHMNWGWAEGKDNGWYISGDVNTSGGNWNNKRKNLYVSPK